MRLLPAFALCCALGAGCSSPQSGARIDPFPQSRLAPPMSGGNAYAPGYMAPGGMAPTFGTPVNTAPAFQTAPNGGGSAASFGTPQYNAPQIGAPQSSLRVVNPTNQVASPQYPSIMPQIVTRIAPPPTGSIAFGGAGDPNNAQSVDEGSRLAFVGATPSSQGFVPVASSSTGFNAATGQLAPVQIAKAAPLSTVASNAEQGNGSQIRLVSHETTVAVAGEPSLTIARDRFGYDPNYRKLKGKLERSRIDQTWKLRYIPLDGETDNFGGSVVIADDSLLNDYKEGDFIVAKGEVVAEGEDGSFAPRYRLDGVERL